MTRNNLRLFLLVLSAGATLLAQDVRYDFDSSADFSKYKTYRWVQHPDSVKVDQLTLTNLGAAFDEVLAKKGLRNVRDESAELVFVFQIATSQERELTVFNSGWGYGPRWGYGGGPGVTTATSSTITIGSLALDMYDANTKKMIWRGVASKSLDPKASPEKRKKNMAKAAEKLLKNYPPRKKT